MIFGQDRSELRKMYVDAWRKRVDGDVLSALETQIADVVALHPEYHNAMTLDDLDKDFAPESGSSNPFLHMGLHLGLREQIATDRPSGISSIFKELTGRLGDTHAAEHQMIDCLAETLWEAQSQQLDADEQRYLMRLQALIGRAAN